VKKLKWDSNLSVEIKEIDEDHHKLVDLFNMLNDSVTQGDSREYIEAVLEELITCTAWHFRHEERLMLKHRYPNFESHKAEHKDLIDSVREVQQQVLNGEKALSNELIEFLEVWLTEHILTTDMPMATFLNDAM
jgi:hemerythrin-like metal-binding protein